MPITITSTTSTTTTDNESLLPPEPSLSDLCSLCKAQPPKYRCPACSTRTCSLACSRKHKVYTQCSGRQDPTAFVGRAKLATPATLNRDFNFLAGVERALVPRDNSDETEGLRGEWEGNERKKRKMSNWVETLFEDSGVKVKRAPRGMKRAVENSTRLSGPKKKRYLLWTVEWVLMYENNSRILDPVVSEHTPVAQAFFKSQRTHLAQPGDADRVRFYLKKVGCPANRQGLIQLDGASALACGLRGQVVEEFPCIYVWLGEEHPPGFVVEGLAEREVVEEMKEVQLEEEAQGEMVEDGEPGLPVDSEKFGGIGEEGGR